MHGAFITLPQEINFNIDDIVYFREIEGLHTTKMFDIWSLSRGQKLIRACHWFRSESATFQSQNPGTVLRNGKQFRVNISEYFQGSFKMILGILKTCLVIATRLRSLYTL